jgi:SOS-response transcriptional repressor LexA
MSNTWIKETPNCFVLEVDGEAMAPSILDGDVLYIDSRQQPRANNDDLACLKVDGEFHVCRFVRYGKQIMMFHENAPVSVVPSSIVEVIGKVIGGSFMPVNKENHSAGNTAVFV